MKQYTEELKELLNRIPRRHTIENVKDINGIVNNYETILTNIEGVNTYYEKNTAIFFTALDTIKTKIKMSADNKASKKNKDIFFDEASGMLKDDIQNLMGIYGDGNKTE
jgi:hypothetical protein